MYHMYIPRITWQKSSTTREEASQLAAKRVGLPCLRRPYPRTQVVQGSDANSVLVETSRDSALRLRLLYLGIWMPIIPHELNSSRVLPDCSSAGK